MSSANVDAMVREAKRAIRAGNKSEAQKLLLKATELDQSNEQAWMWLSAVVDSIEDQMICLENVLQINPSNADAKRGLEMLRKKAPPPAEKPPSKPNNPFLIEDVEWEIDANTDFLLDALSPSSSKPNTSSSSSARDLLSDDTDDPINPLTDPFVSVFESQDVFGTTYDDEPSSLLDDNDSYSTELGGFDDVSSLDDAIFGDDANDDVDEFLSADTSFFDDEPPAPTPKPAQKGAPQKQKAPAQPESAMSGIDDDADPSVYFEMIPADIKPTRIPGIDESYPSMLIPSIIGLVLLNIGALVLLIL